VKEEKLRNIAWACHSQKNCAQWAIGAVVQAHLADIPFTKSAQTLVLRRLSTAIGRFDILLLNQKYTKFG